MLFSLVLGTSLMYLSREDLFELGFFFYKVGEFLGLFLLLRLPSSFSRSYLCCLLEDYFGLTSFIESLSAAVCAY